MLAEVVATITCLWLLKRWWDKIPTETTKYSFEEDFEEDISTTTKNIYFRPATFKEYIGQEKSKKRLNKYLEAIKERNKTFPHILIYGKPGTGKTTLARILANELNVHLVEYVASSINTNGENLIELFNNVGNGILFLDEIHALDRKKAEKFYTAMEDFRISGAHINPFTLVGATTELGEILKNRKPFYDRFKIIIELENYTIQELMTIAKQYKNSVFKDEKPFSKTLYLQLAENCRFNPRQLIRLLESTVYFDNNIKEVFENFGIVRYGYTIKDLKVLQYIALNKTVGLQGIASYLDTDIESYLYEIEPYLLQSGMISRTPQGRMITPTGKQLVDTLKIKEKQ